MDARRGDDDDAEALPSEVQSEGSSGGDSGGEDAEPVGFTVSGASDADRAMAITSGRETYRQMNP